MSRFAKYHQWKFLLLNIKTFISFQVNQMQIDVLTSSEWFGMLWLLKFTKILLLKIFWLRGNFFVCFLLKFSDIFSCQTVTRFPYQDAMQLPYLTRGCEKKICDQNILTETKTVISLTHTHLRITIGLLCGSELLIESYLCNVLFQSLLRCIWSRPPSS